MQPVGDRPREVCSVCGKVFYQNPLPAAAALVLDDQRRVLLVKRKLPPNKGMWCLPIGFAEMGETIAEAALRELHEETGVVGRVTRLIDADSWKSGFYGDLLVVTFEVEKISGAETAGDDAEDVRYFAIDHLPPLAFPSNEKAIRLCAELHEDDWAIHDSFQPVRGGHGRGDALGQSGRLRGRARRVRGPSVAGRRALEPHHDTLHAPRPRLPADGVHHGAAAAGPLAGGREHRGRDRSFYRDLGARRRSQGIESYEMLSAVMLLKKHIWTYARSQGVWERPVDAYRVMELQSRFAVFFDRASYHLMRGFSTAS